MAEEDAVSSCGLGGCTISTCGLSGAAAGTSGHCGFVFALALCGDYLCSGGGDSLIMVRVVRRLTSASSAFY